MMPNKVPLDEMLNLSNWLRYKEKRIILNLLIISLTFLVLWPLFGLIWEGVYGLKNGFISIGNDELKQIKGTIVLLIFTCLLGSTIGTLNGWLLSNCRFPGRKILRIFQLIPLATPAYLLAATLIDLGSINSIRIYGMTWGIVIMAFTTYPYVFLLSTESFLKGGKSQLEACRSLGIGPWRSFFRIALPIAIPSIGAGTALMGMEVVNELGAVQLLNIPSISYGIYENWIEKDNPSGAIALALIALIIVICFVAYERILRQKNKRWSESLTGASSIAWNLKGSRAFFAQLVTILPPLFTLGVPITWAISNSDQLNKGIDSQLLEITFRSLAFGLITAAITVSISLILSVSKRWELNKYFHGLTFLSGIGYAIPGSVLALALLSFSNSPWNLNPLTLLIWGYSIRFLAIPKGGLDAAFERISPNIDEAAKGLGSNWTSVLRKIHIPLLKGPLGVGALLVFVDTIKELPLTFILRPFDSDTLSVRIFQYAGDERMADSILPALIILLLGLMASFALIPSIENKQEK